MLTRMHVEKALPLGYQLEDSDCLVGCALCPVWEIVEETTGKRARLGLPALILGWSSEKLAATILEEIASLELGHIPEVANADVCSDSEEYSFDEGYLREIENDRKYY